MWHDLCRCSPLRPSLHPLCHLQVDIVTVDGIHLRPMPGWLAREYGKMGGEVHLMGKVGLRWCGAQVVKCRAEGLPSCPELTPCSRRLGGALEGGGRWGSAHLRSCMLRLAPCLTARRPVAPRPRLSLHPSSTKRRCPCWPCRPRRAWPSATAWSMTLQASPRAAHGESACKPPTKTGVACGPSRLGSRQLSPPHKKPQETSLWLFANWLLCLACDALQARLLQAWRLSLWRVASMRRMWDWRLQMAQRRLRQQRRRAQIGR